MREAAGDDRRVGDFGLGSVRFHRSVVPDICLSFGG